MTSHGFIFPADPELQLMKNSLHITSYTYHPDVGGNAEKYKICADKTIEFHVQQDIEDPDDHIIGKGGLRSRGARIIFSREQFEMVCPKLLIHVACEVDDDGNIQDSEGSSPITMEGSGIHIGGGQRIYVGENAMEPITLRQELYTFDEYETDYKIYTLDAVSGQAVHDYIRETTQDTIYWFNEQGDRTEYPTDQPVNGQAVYEAINERLGDLEGKNAADFVWEKLNESINQINERLDSIEDRLTNIEGRLN
jgi:tetrahydromethanopterin S-methyltransferase subunit G